MWPWQGSLPPALQPVGPANLKVAALAADYTNAATTMSAITGGGKALSVPVLSGHRYAFEAVLFCNDSSTARIDGGKFDFDASTATMTNFRSCADDGSGAAFGANITGYTTTLAGDHASNWELAAADVIVIRGELEPSADGTFAMRAAQNAHSDGTLTIYRGSSLTVRETTE